MTDQLSTCPKCGCDGCYIAPVNETKNTYFCWGCGFQTNDLMKEGEFDFTGYEETLPELYREIKYVDAEKRVWYPIVLNVEEKGTVFLNGTSKEDVHWAGIKTVPLTEEEKQQPKYKSKSHKSQAKSLKNFGNDFIEAVDYVGLFNV